MRNEPAAIWTARLLRLWSSAERTILTPRTRAFGRVTHPEATRRLAGESWGWYQVPVHLHHFTLKSLRLLLDRHGFAVEKSYVRGGDTVFVVLTLLSLLGRTMTPGGAAPSALQSQVLRLAGVLLRPYYRLGDDELILIAGKRRQVGTTPYLFFTHPITRSSSRLTARISPLLPL